MIRIAICDNSLNDIVVIKKMLDKYAEEHALEFYVKEYNDGTLFLNEYASQFDLIILDIQMGSNNGVNVAKLIRKVDKEVSILFYTSYKEYAFYGYELDVSGYLVKPVDYKKVSQNISKVLTNMKRGNESITVRFAGNIKDIPVKEICYIEHRDHKMCIYLTDGTVQQQMGRFGSVLEQDSSSMLLMIHRSIIVNKMWITKYEDNNIFLKGLKDGIMVSRARRKQVEKEYLEFCKEKFK